MGKKEVEVFARCKRRNKTNRKKKYSIAENEKKEKLRVN